MGLVALATNAGHPGPMSLQLNSEVTETLRIHFSLDPHLGVNEKALFASFWSQRCKEPDSE